MSGRQGLCRLWRGLCLRGAGLVTGSGWGAADASGPGGRGGGPGRDGGVDGWWAARRVTVSSGFMSDEASSCRMMRNRLSTANHLNAQH